VPLDKWDGVRLPAYTAPLEPAHSMIHATTLQGAAKKYLDSLREGGGKLIDTGIPNLDFALGGGLEMGELVIVAARPSHGKSAFALQLAHYWTGQGSPAIIVSEEMSAISLGKRAMQYISAVPQEHWPHSLPSLDKDLADYGDSRSECLIVEGCRTAEAACEQISKAVEEKKIKVAIIDYAQLLTAKGQGRYEQVTNTSIAIRQVTNKHSILTIMLCQLNREIEKRKKFTPQNSDLRDSGGLEQDADVILCLVWPHRLDSANLPHYFQIFVHKNRNRPINETQVECHFNPSRQMLLDAKPRSAPPDTPGYEQAFDLPLTDGF
jgi:replicative DNA helicase